MWQTLESDPGLFTELVESWGVENVEFNEIFGLDPASFAALECGAVFGVIFLFNHTARPADAVAPRYAAADAPVFFARQVVENSCASQALLGLVLSRAAAQEARPRAPAESLALSAPLQQLREFCAGMDAETSGQVVGSSEFLRERHNRLCAPPAFVDDDAAAAAREREPDAFHYVAFVPVAGRIYELDGLRPAPIDHGPITTSTSSRDNAALDAAQEENEEVVAALCRVLQARVAQFGAEQLGFSVMVASADLRRAPAHAHDAAWAAQQAAKRTAWRRENALRAAPLTGLAVELLRQL